VVDRFVDIGGIVDHHYFNFLFTELREAVAVIIVW
jgi:hypothetical protein